MPAEINFMVGGESGQNYKSRVRGSHNLFRIRVRDNQVSAITEPVDTILVLNKESIELQQKKLADDGVIISDDETTGLVE